MAKIRKSVVDADMATQNILKGVPNPTVYDDKIPTNVRIEASLKEKLDKDKDELSCTISDIVNDALREWYKHQK